MVLFFAWNLFTKKDFTQADFEIIQTRLDLFIGLYLVLIILKDIFNGRSIGKCILGICVKDKMDLSSTPNIFRLMARNILLLLWPVELLTFLIMNKRLGDVLVKTVVIKTK
jgi:hypothetical protein